MWFIHIRPPFHCSLSHTVDDDTNYINSRDDWEFIGVYPDDGISATTTKKREGVNLT